MAAASPMSRARPARVVFDGVACEGKAALVLGGRSARVEGLIFQNIRVARRQRRRHPARGGRPDGPRIACSATARTASSSPTTMRGTIRVDQSTFSGLGQLPGRWRLLAFHLQQRHRRPDRHPQPLRARHRRPLSEEPRRPHRGHRFELRRQRRQPATNYMIDLSNGATGTIARNIFVQGANKENYSAFIMVAPEGVEHSSAGLAVTDNEAGPRPRPRPPHRLRRRRERRADHHREQPPRPPDRPLRAALDASRFCSGRAAGYSRRRVEVIARGL